MGVEYIEEDIRGARNGRGLCANVPHFYCDGCGEDIKTLYSYDGGDWCAACLIEKLTDDGVIEKVEQSIVSKGGDWYR